MGWISLYVLLSFLVMISGTSTGSRICPYANESVVQMCADHQVSGDLVRMEKQNATSTGDNCTCDVDLGGGAIRYIEYRGPTLNPCVIQLVVNNSHRPFNCSNDTYREVRHISSIEFQQPESPINFCLSIQMLNITNASDAVITCYPPNIRSIVTTTSSSETRTTPTQTSVKTNPRPTVSTSSSTSAGSTLTGTTISPFTGTTISSLTDTTVPSLTDTSTIPPSDDSTAVPSMTKITANTLGKKVIVGVSAGGGALVVAIVTLVFIIRCIRIRNESLKEVVITENELYVAANDVRTSSRADEARSPNELDDRQDHMGIYENTLDTDSYANSQSPKDFSTTILTQENDSTSIRRATAALNKQHVNQDIPLTKQGHRGQHPRLEAAATAGRPTPPTKPITAVPRNRVHGDYYTVVYKPPRQK